MATRLWSSPLSIHAVNKDWIGRPATSHPASSSHCAHQSSSTSLDNYRYPPHSKTLCFAAAPPTKLVPATTHTLPAKNAEAPSRTYIPIPRPSNKYLCCHKAVCASEHPRIPKLPQKLQRRRLGITLTAGRASAISGRSRRSRLLLVSVSFARLQGRKQPNHKLRTAHEAEREREGQESALVKYDCLRGAEAAGCTRGESQPPPPPSLSHVVIL
jgi:hypothetical protein